MTAFLFHQQGFFCFRLSFQIRIRLNAIRDCGVGLFLSCNIRVNHIGRHLRAVEQIRNVLVLGKHVIKQINDCALANIIYLRRKRSRREGFIGIGGQRNVSCFQSQARRHRLCKLRFTGAGRSDQQNVLRRDALFRLCVLMVIPNIMNRL